MTGRRTPTPGRQACLNTSIGSTRAARCAGARHAIATAIIAAVAIET